LIHTMGITAKAGTDKSLDAFGAVGCPHLIRFGKLVGLFKELHDVVLTIPSFTGTGEENLSSFKSFCSGLIERRNHLWSVPIRRLGIRQRMSIAHTLFLFRKTLPSKQPCLDKYLDQISAESPEVDPHFTDFCEKTVRDLFPVGWDKYSYPSACLSTSVSTSSCRENGRMFGGCRSWVLDCKMPNITDREGFVESCLVGTKYDRPSPSKLCAVHTGGKWRKITVPSGNLSLLRPLHNSIYNHISKTDWLLRGKESPARFNKFTRVLGEIFVSGDYESATDFLNSGVSKTVLSQILLRSRSVPNGIRRMAMDSLSLPVQLNREDESTRVVDQRSGQMMGYLLSFPLLCIINYITFKYAVPRDVPVKINGDDIVFRGTPREYEDWKKVVNKSGLVLSVGKTLVDNQFFTLNSCLFYGESHKVKAVPFIRSTALFPKDRDPESVMGLSGRFRAFCPGYSGEKKEFLRTEFLRLNRCLIDVTRRSVSRGLGLPVNFPMIVNSGLWIREAWYLSLEQEKPIPAPFASWSNPPPGYKFMRVEKKTKEILQAEEGLSAAFVEAAWMPARSGVDGWFDELKSGSYDYGHWFFTRSNDLKRRAKLLGHSRRFAQRYLKPNRNLFKDDEHKKIRHGVWVKEDFVPTLSMRRGCDVDGSAAPEERFFINSRTPARLSQDATEKTIDYRNYMKVNIEVDEIFLDDDLSLVSPSEVELSSGDLGFILKKSCDIAARLYPRGVGIAPPPCLL